MKEWIRDLSIQAWAERKRYYQEIFIGDLEKELGTGTRLYTGNTQTWQNSLSGRRGKTGILDTPMESQSSNLTVFFLPLMQYGCYLEVLPLMFPLEVFCTPKKWGFSQIRRFLPIGISLCGPIRGTRSDGKLNLINNLYIKKTLRFIPSSKLIIV